MSVEKGKVGKEKAAQKTKKERLIKIERKGTESAESYSGYFSSLPWKGWQVSRIPSIIINPNWKLSPRKSAINRKKAPFPWKRGKINWKTKKASSLYTQTIAPSEWRGRKYIPDINLRDGGGSGEERMVYPVLEGRGRGPLFCFLSLLVLPLLFFLLRRALGQSREKGKEEGLISPPLTLVSRFTVCHISKKMLIPRYITKKKLSPKTLVFPHFSAIPCPDSSSSSQPGRPTPPRPTDRPCSARFSASCSTIVCCILLTSLLVLEKGNGERM